MHNLLMMRRVHAVLTQARLRVVAGSVKDGAYRDHDRTWRLLPVSHPAELHPSRPALSR